ncbi:MAG: hypothetical protein IKL68_02410 [Clostridia bacterium]|nr:hypothetical protein [Clostridia bacterium]
MKFILFEVEDEKKLITTNEYEVLKEKKIKEVILSKNKLNKLSEINSKQKQNVFDRIKLKLFMSRLNKIVREKDNEETRYILSKELNMSEKRIRYLISTLETLGLKKIGCLNEMDRNIFKYVDEYSVKNKINIQDIRMLFVYKEQNNISLNVIREAVRNYKKVNIYLKGNVNKELLEKVDKINDSDGCVIEIIKYNKKAFIDYDVIYYADDYRLNYPRMRLNKKTCIIDLEDSIIDKYNSNIIFFNKIENKKDIIGYIVNRYGLLPLAYALRQM